jgi:hypothetical protein
MNDMYSIISRLARLEESLDSAEKSVNTLGPTEKAKKISVLTAKTDPKHPFDGKLVGGCEESVSEEVSQDMLSKVKSSLTDYLEKLEDSKKADEDLIAKKKEDLDLKKKEIKDLELQIKQKKEQEEALEEDPTDQPGVEGTGELQDPTYGEGYDQPAVKTVVMDDMTECGIYGDEETGFEIRRGNKILPSKFKAMNDAEMALDMYRAHRARKSQVDNSADYLEEK